MTKAVDAQAQTVWMQGTEIRRLMASSFVFGAVVADGFSNRKQAVDPILVDGDGYGENSKAPVREQSLHMLTG